MAVKRKYRLNLRNYGNLPAIMLSQYDEGYALEFEIRDGTDAASDLSAYTVTLKGTRADTLAYSFSGTIATNVLTFVIDTTMTACDGRGTAEIAIKDTANDVLFATFNMPVFVERAAVPEGSIDADVERAQEIAEQVQEIVDNAAAAVSGEAEKWATGQINGTDVPDTDPTYENNAKYYAEQAADSAASIGIDATLTQAGKAADAKKTGDEIADLKEDLNAEKVINRKLLEVFQHIAFKDAEGEQVYQELNDLINPPVAVASVSAVYDNSQVVYNTDSLNYLKSALTVTATYSDGTHETVSDYTLSGNMSGGNQTITVSYGGKTTTFTVMVYEFEFTKGLLSGQADGKAVIKSNTTRILGSSLVGSIPMKNEGGTDSIAFAIPHRSDCASIGLTGAAEYRRAFIIVRWDDTLNGFVQVYSTGWGLMSSIAIAEEYRNSEYLSIINVSGETGSEDMSNVDTSGWSAFFRSES